MLENYHNNTFEEDNEDIKFSYTDESYQFPKIKAASVDRLIERLSHETYPDIKFRTTFMLTYRSFMDPYQLLQKLDARFHKRYTDDSITKTIQLRVVGVVKAWIENYSDDFFDDDTLNDELVQLINKMGKSLGAPALQLNNILQKRLEKHRANPDVKLKFQR